MSADAMPSYDLDWYPGVDNLKPLVLPSAPAINLASYAQARLDGALAAGKTFNVAADGQPALNVLCDGTSATRADLALLALYGQQNPTGTKTWVDNNGVSDVLTGAQLVTLATVVGTWIDDGYAALGAALAAINAAPPTVTSTDQVDAAMAFS